MADFPRQIEWTESYDEALEFFHWEPQDLGQRKHANARFDTEDKVRRHLRLMETTLNQLLQQFFLLAPSQLRNGLFGQVFGRQILDDFALCARRSSRVLQ